MSFFSSIKKSLGIEIERAPYEVIQKISDDVEIRKYPKTKWATTSLSGQANDMSNKNGVMFNKLFKYISGTNDRSQKIAMTAPVTFDFKPSNENEKIKENSSVKMSMRFLVPKEYQDNTPVPTNDAHLEEDPEMIAAVIRFGGYASVTDWIKYRDILIERLGNEAIKYDTVNMMAAGYDPPFKPIGRTNEVWLKKIA